MVLHDEDFVGYSAETKEDKMQKNPWLQSLRSRKLIDYIVGQARLVGLNDELIGTFHIDKTNPGITWTMTFFHDFENPFIELEAQIRTANEDGHFNSHWPSQEASFKIFRENIKGFEVRKVIMDEDSDKDPGPLPSIRDRMTHPNDQSLLIAPASLIENQPEYIENGRMWCLLIHLAKESEVSRQGAGLFCERDYGGLTNTMINIRDHLHETEALCMFVQTNVLESRLKDIIAGFESQVIHPYGPFFGDHPTKPFLQIGQLNLSPPRVTSQATLSFHDIDEYIVKAGYGTVIENSQEQQFIGVGEAIQCDLVTVLPPGVSTDSPPNELLGFLTMPEGYSIPQPGEKFSLLFSKFVAAIPQVSWDVQEQTSTFHGSPQRKTTEDWGRGEVTNTNDWRDVTTTDNVPHPKFNPVEALKHADLHGEPTVTEEQHQTQSPPESDSGMPRDAEEYSWEHGWRCTVLTPAPFSPDSTVTIYMRCSLDEETNQPFIPEEGHAPRPITPKTNDPKFDFHDVLSKEQPHECLINRTCSQKPYRQQISACHALVKWGGSIHPTLLANNAMRLPEVNVYQSITPENLVEYANRVKEDKSMNKEQISCFEKFQKLRGPIGVVQGPPGTGKTFTLVKCALPFLLYPKKDVSPNETSEAPERSKIPDAKRTRPARHQVLLVAPTNGAADHLAQSMNETIKKHSDEFSSGIPKVVRVYPIHAEKDSYDKPDAALHSIDEATVTNADVEQALQTEMVYKLFMDYYAENKPSRPGTRSSDSRITLHELSLGHQIIEFAQNDARWDPWLEDRDRLANGNLDSQQKLDYMAYGKYMLQQVLADSDIVVCTLFSAGQHIIREAISPDAIFIDEAAMTKETDLWPLYTFYTSVPLLLFGDHNQLQSVVKSNPESNQFYTQLRVSPFARFVYAGFLVELLREQHRMAPDISAIVNRIFYANQLRDAQEVTLLHNKMAQKIREWNKTDCISCESNAIFVDVRDAIPEKMGYSIFNKKFAEQGIILCRALLCAGLVNPKDIVFLTPYEAQYRLYQRLLVQAHVQSPQRGFNQVDVRKVGSFQGQESPVVILDVTFTEKLGFMSVSNRWNVALSRARNALYVLCDRSGIRKKGSRIYSVAELIRIIDNKKLWVESLQQLREARRGTSKGTKGMGEKKSKSRKGKPPMNRQAPLGRFLFGSLNRARSLNVEPCINVHQYGVQMISVRDHCIKEFSSRTYSYVQLPRFGKSFLAATGAPIKRVLRLIMQLAARLFFDWSPPSVELFSLTHFHKGRAERFQTTTPSVNEFFKAMMSSSDMNKSDFWELR
ncbi:uncharacterized protein N7484_002234 [Penicillium longicatenatum]|uniref:uncharacterized protein n=1 Tax=Penicillium longicatenatum TaxID=1561947 RepID=UPI002549AD4C|nr:uncharacterized protein N7484_002234 [Penicillium longicatenatum]KAJ5658585.1 hypothetical protein N7484_002234 [Penicillium longicatenatum]